MTWLLDDRTALYARDLIRAGRKHGPLPAYGDEIWWSLSVGSPQRLAAIFVAAESHRHTLHPAVIAEDMAQEMRNLNDHIAYLFVQTSHDVASALDWEAVFRRPDHATLCERRGEPEKAERARAWFRGVA